MIYVFFWQDYIFWYFSTLLVKPRILNISINSSSLNIFSSSFFYLMEIIDRTSVFPKGYDILGFSSFLYLPQITQSEFSIFLITENI